MAMSLEGMKVVDLTRMGPGPFCTMVLGDLGADVLRVEEVGTGRYTQWRGDRSEEGRARREGANAFNALNRNKRSIALNLKHPEAQQVLHRLCEGADVFAEGFRPGVAKRLGCDYETLKGINPRLVYCSISGYGQDGPYQNLVGHDINYISVAGALGLIGPKDGPPMIPLNLVADFGGGGMLAVIGILAALMARGKSGQGQYVDVSLMDSVVYLLGSLASSYFGGGHVPRRGEETLNGGIPHYNVYKCKDGKYISLGCLEPWFWQNLCRALGREDLVPHQNNPEKYQEIFAFLQEKFRTKTRDDWFEELRSQGDIAVAKVLDVDEVFLDPQVAHRQMKARVGQVNGDPVWQIGVAPKLSNTPGSIRRLGPQVGEHTDEVLSSLGYTTAQAKALREQGAAG